MYSKNLQDGVGTSPGATNSWKKKTFHNTELFLYFCIKKSFITRASSQFVYPGRLDKNPIQCYLLCNMKNLYKLLLCLQNVLSE